MFSDKFLNYEKTYIHSGIYEKKKRYLNLRKPVSSVVVLSACTTKYCNTLFETLELNNVPLGVIKFCDVPCRTFYSSWKKLYKVHFLKQVRSVFFTILQKDKP